jgi:paraquat-inducible protein B
MIGSASSSVVRLPRALPRPRGRLARGAVKHVIWLLPGLVLAASLWFGARALWQRGPVVTVTFTTADGIEAHKTAVRYKGVSIGVVTGVALREDRTGVVVTAELSRAAKRLLVDDARFWVVRPRVSAAGVSGIGTLLTGAHIAFDAGLSGASRRAYEGLEAPPPTINGRRGRRFTLRAEDMGSLDVGAPVYLRRFRVGEVTRMALDETGDAAVLEIFVDEPYDRHVSAETRFWNASGIDVTVGPSGVQLDTQSLASVLTGGIAFSNPEGAAPAPPAAPGATFRLFSGQRAAWPSAGGGPDDLAGAVSRLVAKLNDVPLDRLADEGVRTMRQMRRTLARTERLVDRVDADLAPELRAVLGQAGRTLGSMERTFSAEAPLQQDLRRALREVGGAGQAVRLLGEYLERHPESIIRGKGKDRR